MEITRKIQEIPQTVWIGIGITTIVSLILWAGIYSAYLMNFVGTVPMLALFAGTLFFTVLSTAIYTCKATIQAQKALA